MNKFSIGGRTISWRQIIFYGLLLVLSYISNTVTPASQKKNVTPRVAEVSKESSAAATISLASGSAQVIRVIDGDTIEIEGGVKVRYIGINTPESVDPRREVQCFGKESSEENKRLVGGKTVRLEKDVSETDKYGRLLRYVYVGDKFINDVLVREGFAYASTYPPDVRYATQFTASQKAAKDSALGLWERCPRR